MINHWSSGIKSVKKNKELETNPTSIQGFPKMMAPQFKSLDHFSIEALNHFSIEACGDLGIPFKNPPCIAAFNNWIIFSLSRSQLVANSSGLPPLSQLAGPQLRGLRRRVRPSGPATAEGAEFPWRISSQRLT